MIARTTIRMVNLLVALRRLPPLCELSGDEERLLFELHDLYEQRGAIEVSDVYAIFARKSASTAYRLLMNLKDKGLVEVNVDQEDRRRRQVTFTKTALDLFAACP